MMMRLPALLAFLALIALVAGCGRGGVRVSVSPSEATLAPSETQAFTASVLGASDSRVTWSASCGTVTGSANMVTYAAPEAEGSCVLTATSVADPRASANAEVSIVQVHDARSVGQEGGVVTGIDGVSLVLASNVVDEGERLALAVDRSEEPELPIPTDAHELSPHYLFRLTRAAGVAPSDAGAEDVATASLDGFAIAMPVPEGADLERLALGVLIPGPYLLGGGPDEWAFVEGVFDEDRELFLASVFRVPAEGLRIVLVEHADAVTTLNRADSSGLVEQAVWPPTSPEWLSSFSVKAVGTRAESAKADYEAFLQSLTGVFRDGGFAPLLLTVTGRTFDWSSLSWDYSNASYKVTVRQYRDVSNVTMFSRVCSRSAEHVKDGVFNPILASITLCTDGSLSASGRRTAVHELFHASQFGNPAVAKVNLDLLGHRDWIYEGTAVLSEGSMLNAGYAIERAWRPPRPVDVRLQSSGSIEHMYEYRAQDFFAYLGERLGEDFRYVRHVFAEGPRARDLAAVLDTRYGLSWADAYSGWVFHQLESVPWGCDFVEATLIENARSLSFQDGTRRDSSFIVDSLNSASAIITLENRDPERPHEWGLTYHHQDGRSRSRLYAMDPSSTAGCLTPLSSGATVGLTPISVSVEANELRRLLLVIPHIDISERISTGFLQVDDHGYASPPPVSVSVEPSRVTLPLSGTQSFTATVTGATDTSVSWSATCGTISGNGMMVTYTAPATEGSCEVTASSVAAPQVSATATVTVVSGSLPLLRGVARGAGPSASVAASYVDRVDGSVDYSGVFEVDGAFALDPVGVPPTATVTVDEAFGPDDFPIAYGGSALVTVYTGVTLDNGGLILLSDLVDVDVGWCSFDPTIVCFGPSAASRGYVDFTFYASDSFGVSAPDAVLDFPAGWSVMRATYAGTTIDFSVETSTTGMAEYFSPEQLSALGRAAAAPSTSAECSGGRVVGAVFLKGFGVDAPKHCEHAEP